jgi:hypothetical protein
VTLSLFADGVKSYKHERGCGRPFRLGLYEVGLSLYILELSLDAVRERRESRVREDIESRERDYASSLCEVVTHRDIHLRVSQTCDPACLRNTL